MPGRFVVTLPLDAMAQLFTATLANDLPMVPNYNICPTMQIHVVSGGESGRAITAMRWGFVPGWYKSLSDGPLLINARAETIAEKPAFRAAARSRRCLIPASGFYEWTKTTDGARLPWFTAPADDGLLALAGVWQEWESGGGHIATCAVLTTPANETMSRIHHRMPVIIAPDDYGLWLGEAGKGAARLMVAAVPDLLAFHRVDPAVNSNRAHGPELIEPISQ